MSAQQTKRDYQTPALTTLDLLAEVVEVVEGTQPIVSGEMSK